MRRREAQSQPTLSLRREDWRRSRAACQDRGVPGEVVDAKVRGERARVRRRAGISQTRWERLITKQSRTCKEKYFPLKVRAEKGTVL